MGVRAPMETTSNGEEAPDSWEMAEASIIRLLPPASTLVTPVEPRSNVVVTTPTSTAVDDFLREALQNPHDRMNILRLEQEVERFLRTPGQQQLEFAPMPSSYMRLAAHRVAQHYHLQTSVLDSSSADGCRIIVRKCGETRFPATKLADVPVTTTTSFQDETTTESATTRFVIKQRPQARYRGATTGNGSVTSSGNIAKSVEERNEEYNRARARIFRTEKEKEQRAYDELVELESKQQCSKLAETPTRDEQSKKASKMTAKEVSAAAAPPQATLKPKQKVAIFRDREKDRKDPDYDRNYDRYSQRFDPGFGLNTTQQQPAYGMQRYTPVVNYNTEFPQLGGPSVRPMHGQAPAHLAGQQQHWNAGGYQRRDMMRPPFNPGAQHSNMAAYMSHYAYHPQQYTTYPQISQQPETGSSQSRRR